MSSQYVVLYLVGRRVLTEQIIGAVAIMDRGQVRKEGIGPNVEEWGVQGRPPLLPFRSGLRAK